MHIRHWLTSDGGPVRAARQADNRLLVFRANLALAV